MFNIEKLEDLRPYIIDAEPHFNHGGGHFMRLRFPNWYGASIIRTPCSYGGDDGLFELAVLRFTSTDNNDYGLAYDTPITDDVIGHLEFCDVVLNLFKIKNLPPAPSIKGVIENEKISGLLS